MIETLREVFLYNVLVHTKSWVDSLKHYLMIAICYLNLGFNGNGRSAKNQVLDAQQAPVIDQTSILGTVTEKTTAHNNATIE